jgi:putative membrane protein
MLTLNVLLGTLLYAVVGIVIFVISFVLVDKLTPGDLWKEIVERQNVAVAVVAGAVAIGISSIIAAAVHG